LIEIGSKTAEKNSAQTNKQTNRQTNRHYENNGDLAVTHLCFYCQLYPDVFTYNLAFHSFIALRCWFDSGNDTQTVLQRSPKSGGVCVPM